MVAPKNPVGQCLMCQLSISQLKDAITQVVGFVGRIPKKELQVRNMSFEFLSHVTATQDSIIEYFQDHGVLRPKTNPFLCPIESCVKAMSWTKRNDINDGYVSSCSKHRYVA